MEAAREAGRDAGGDVVADDRAPAGGRAWPRRGERRPDGLGLGGHGPDPGVAGCPTIAGQDAGFTVVRHGHRGRGRTARTALERRIAGPRQPVRVAGVGQPGRVTEMQQVLSISCHTVTPACRRGVYRYDRVAPCRSNAHARRKGAAVRRSVHGRRRPSWAGGVARRALRLAPGQLHACRAKAGAEAGPRLRSLIAVVPRQTRTSIGHGRAADQKVPDRHAVEVRIACPGP